MKKYVYKYLYAEKYKYFQISMYIIYTSCLKILTFTYMRINDHLCSMKFIKCVRFHNFHLLYDFLPQKLYFIYLYSHSYICIIIYVSMDIFKYVYIESLMCTNIDTYICIFIYAIIHVHFWRYQSTREGHHTDIASRIYMYKYMHLLIAYVCPSIYLPFFLVIYIYTYICIYIFAYIRYPDMTAIEIDQRAVAFLGEKLPGKAYVYIYECIHFDSHMNL
jgi:hypothetical protein